MPVRPVWKGFLKISLVNIPVSVFSATEASATLSFHQLHAVCQTRIEQRRWCPHCEREVPYDEVVKGYEFERGHYVVVPPEDFAKVHVESTRVINLETFTDVDAVDSIYLERAYYLAPDGKAARDAFVVMREGMKGKAGIGKVALYGREYLVKVEPRDRGFVMYTLRHTTEIRSMDAIDELAELPASAKASEVKLAQQVIGTFEGEADLASFHDEYQESLRAVIDARIQGHEVVTTDLKTPPKVVNLMDALRKSLESVSSSKKKPARARLQPVHTSGGASHVPRRALRRRTG